MTPQMRDAWRASTWERALAWIRTEHFSRPIDLFLSYLYPEQVEPGALRELRELGIPAVNFFCDNVRLFRSVPREFAGFALNWVPESGAAAMYARAGVSYISAPMACWVPPEYRSVPSVESLPPTFVGTRDVQRERLFERAFNCGLQMELRGTGWKSPKWEAQAPPSGKGAGLILNQVDFAMRHGWKALALKVGGRLFPAPKVMFDFSRKAASDRVGGDYLAILRECRVCVGVNRFPDPSRPAGRPRSYSRLRDLEAPMAGAAYLTESAPGLEQLYDIGKEIEVYRSAEELAEKVAALDADTARRTKLRSEGQRRALSDHSISRTIDRIAERLGISGR
jgi:hypothetical protein